MKPIFRHLFLFFLAGLLLLTSCDRQEKKKIVVGLSQCMLDDAWRQTMIRETLIEASNHDDLEVIVRNADTDNRQQIAQIRELIALGVDVLIISPNESDPLTSVAEEAYQAGIPTIITDRKISSELYTTFVGASNYDIGRDAGLYASRNLPPNATILEIWGLSTSSPAQERHTGFVEALVGRSDLSFIKLEGEWRYDTTAVRIARRELPRQIDLVYAHNDVMALAAREYFMAEDSARGKEVHIIGVDAAPGAGLEAVADGRINMSFLYPRGGEEVIRAALKIARGETVPRHIPLHTAQIDRDIARTLLLQADQLINYQRRIEGQVSRLEELFNRYHFLQNSLWIISFLMVGMVVLMFYIFHLFKKMRRTNRTLREINKKEEEQRRKLIALNAEIKEVTAQKLQFFTNISHEVRTPLTLILAPLDRLIGLLYDSPYLPDLQLIRKNADRLLRVINQILDFRKIETQQEKVKAREIDFVPFVREVMSYFDSMAAVRHIDYRFVSDLKQCKLWLDSDQMEKVLVNLLSNAFKFTPEKGKIEIILRQEADRVTLRVADSGQGIRAENIPYLFDRFYTEDRSVGTGIGLHMVKEYVAMHGGEVSVESEWGKGTVFSIVLHTGKEHLTGDHVTVTDLSPLSFQASQLDDSEVDAMLAKTYDYTILLVEDDEEVRSFLAGELKDQFRVLTAENGKEALQVLEEQEVSLVLSDVMMPEMNGFELCRTLKTNLSYSHIPVILLTALTDERQRLYGVSRGADGYIQKPFQVNYVKVKIIRLLEDRRLYREQLLKKLQDNHMLLGEPEKAENMDDLFLRRFIAQLEEVYTDAEFNVEKLSDTLGLSRGHLYRKVKELTGTTPVDLLRNFRLNKATQLLRQNQLSVSEIAYQTGFTSPAYFSKCFKAVYAMTPKEYQSGAEPSDS
ncbi:signal transduction histidine kinase/CheY-like chemotaxis protein [Parabacteroides sp. PFB2-12]|uniref:hybrid sensor histidine kinase/response regulator transcription factor n=1 Tax=unclassified Parabacteroides TaxID=2649774 RepID=UPI0024770A1E|nr:MULTISPECIES: substrate-binding domain-containing protein [unclassified Parabacteroides]MDH6341458.1 signal transduction histidine kinase/CheY-like chemotaxis protein [Parabacteroides sp. PM6-13]MDH6389252.1 signal transduction histidine kinase/CheY-like chemotaxis protein [Parabacteroides sp. PFB2-12]